MRLFYWIAILESNINRAIGNDWFRTKISTTIFDKTGYKDSIYPSAKYLVKKYESNSKPFWTKEDIARTTNNIAERIVKFIFED